MSKDTLTITDNRTDKTYESPVELGTIRAMDLRKIKTGPDDFGLMTYDPAFTNTVSCKSAITFIDGDKGILRYRGYDIETLAEHCTYLQVAYLLLFGELPTPQQDKDWTWEITHHTMLHESTKHFIDGFRYDAHPMGILVSTLAALSTVYPEAKDIHDPENRQKQIVRLIGKDGDPGGVFLSPPPRASICISRQRSQLHRKLHEHAVEDDRAEVPGQPGHCPRARCPVHSPRRPRAELQFDHHAGDWQRANRSVPLHGRRGSSAWQVRCMAAPTKKCCACWMRSAR